MYTFGYKVRDNFQRALERAYSIDDYEALLSRASINELTYTVAWAAQQNHYKVIDLLIEKYDLQIHNLDEHGTNLLHHAALGGNFVGLGLLAKKYGLDPQALDNYSSSILHYAAMGGHVDALECISNEFCINLKSLNIYGLNLLHYAAWGGHTNFIEKLVEKFNFDINSLDADGSGVLHYAALGAKVDAIEWLNNKYDLDPLALNHKQENTLHWAALGCRINAFHNLILKHGITINLVEEILNLSQLPLKFKNHLKACSDFYSKLTSLAPLPELAKVLDTFPQNQQRLLLSWPIMLGESPLCWSINNGYDDLATLLVRYHAPLNNLPELLLTFYATTLNLALARNGNLEILPKVYGDINAVKKVVKSSLNINAPFYKEDLSILKNGLIEEYLTSNDAYNNPTFADVVIGLPKCSISKRRTSQLIVQCALILRDGELVAKHASILCGDAFPKPNEILKAAKDNNLDVESVLLEVISKIAHLNLEFDQLATMKGNVGTPVNNEAFSIDVSPKSVTPAFSSIHEREKVSESDHDLENKMTSSKRYFF